MPQRPPRQRLSSNALVVSCRLMTRSRLIGTNPVSSSDRLSPISGPNTTRFTNAKDEIEDQVTESDYLHSWRSQNLLCSAPPVNPATCILGCGLVSVRSLQSSQGLLSH
jgi:hypothetical protein